MSIICNRAQIFKSGNTSIVVVKLTATKTQEKVTLNCQQLLTHDREILRKEGEIVRRDYVEGHILV